MASQTVVPKKRRGPAATGKGTQIQVRLQPQMLEILDRLVTEVGTTRPEGLRHVFSQWAEAYGYVKPSDRLRERSLMLSIEKDLLTKIEKHFGSMSADEAIECIIREWLEQNEAGGKE